MFDYYIHLIYLHTRTLPQELPHPQEEEDLLQEKEEPLEKKQFTQEFENYPIIIKRSFLPDTIFPCPHCSHIETTSTLPREYESPPPRELDPQQPT